ncbi:MAG: hypothetical protein KDB53_06740 [Planctomycetes bacterium]|nr:hypothetical protein [Planctomycetota bacterium]
MKYLLILIFAVNLGVLVYNAKNTYGRTMGEERTQVGDAVDRSVRVKKISRQYESDLRRIKDAGYEGVAEPAVYFSNKAQAAGFNTLADGVDIPVSPEETKGTVYIEESWKISFINRDKRFDLKKIIRFCQLIERDAPSFQIKSIDLGTRSEIWGKDEWKPSNIVVRRLRRKERT